MDSFFKEWAPDWLIRLTIFLVLLPGLLVFALYFSNISEASGYYGIEPADVQFSIVLMYAALVSFFPVDDRFFKYLKPKPYFITATLINIVSYYICAITRDVATLMICRFIQGLSCSMLCNFCLNLIFYKLPQQRARALGYGVFYGVIQASIPVCAIFCSWILYRYEFNHLFYLLILMQIPGVVLMLLIMKNIRIKKKFPLYQLDWISYVFYTFILCSAGYILVYGQQLNWFSAQKIKLLSLGIVISAGLFSYRQLHLKRPLLQLRLLRFANVRNGLLLLALYYICKGTTGFTYIFAQQILGLDAIHLIPFWGANIAGIVLGMAISVRFVLLKTEAKVLWITGFAALLVFHLLMYFLFSANVEDNQLYLPLFLQGFGTGWLMVPLVVFMSSAAPISMVGSTPFIGVASRFLGLSIGLAIANYFQLYYKSIHFNDFRQYVTALNPLYTEKISDLQSGVAYSGNGIGNTQETAAALLNKSIANQVFLRSAMDYYSLMILMISVIIILIIFLPGVKQVLLVFRSKVMPY
ncbi:MFS transporter [Pedobacter sp. UYP1]|uniref:MFS transporter n=1 Tax=Pedobacter sp. UYP1 TaxID=1756396 RepID=UPI00339846EA